jgi:hypothetical protein
VAPDRWAPFGEPFGTGSGAVSSDDQDFCTVDIQDGEQTLELDRGGPELFESHSASGETGDASAVRVEDLGEDAIWHGDRLFVKAGDGVLVLSGETTEHAPLDQPTVAAVAGKVLKRL